MIKKGQVTIYIIIGIIIVAVVALFVVLFKTGIVTNPLTPGVDKNPNSYLKDCIQGDVLEIVKKMEPQGGFLEPGVYKRFMFVEEKKAYNIGYLCYNQKNYLGCVNQNPMLISSIEKEIKENIKDTVEECFDDLEGSYKKAGYDVSVSGSEYSVSLQEGEVVVDFDRTIKITKDGQSQNLNKEMLRFSVASEVYDLALVSVEIVNKEVRDCSFDYVAFNKLNPEINIDRYTDDDGTKIYTVKTENLKEFFRFAIKGGCNK